MTPKRSLAVPVSTREEEARLVSSVTCRGRGKEHRQGKEKRWGQGAGRGKEDFRGQEGGIGQQDG